MILRLLTQHDEDGFTLVELLVAMAILGLVMAGVLNVYLTGNSIALTGENRAEAQNGARASLQIEEDLRLAGYGFPPATPAFAVATATSVSFWADLTNGSTILTAPVNPGDRTFTVTSGVGVTSGDTVYLINQSQWETRTVSGTGATTMTVSVGATSGYPVGGQVGRPRRVTYSWDGANIVTKDPGDGTGAQPAVVGVTAFALSYYDSNNNLIALPVADLSSIRRIVIAMTVRSTATQNRSNFTLNTSVRPRNL